MENEFNTEDDYYQVDNSKSRSQLSNYQPRSSGKSFIPHYAGESNAFAIQLFCIDDKHDSR